MRGDGREYLGVSEYQTMPLTKLYRKLNKNKDYRRRRFTKAVRKGFSVKDQLNHELATINRQIEQVLQGIDIKNDESLKGKLED